MSRGRELGCNARQIPHFKRLNLIWNYLLFQVCADLRNPDIHLNETSISYFLPFRPMLGERATMDQVREGGREGGRREGGEGGNEGGG